MLKSFTTATFEKFTQNWAHLTAANTLDPSSARARLDPEQIWWCQHSCASCGCPRTADILPVLGLTWVPVLSQYRLLSNPGEAAGISFQKEFHQLYLVLFCQQQNPSHLLHSLEDGSAFLNLSFGAVSRLYPLFYLTLESVQNAGFSVYPVISSKDWTLSALCQR